MQNAVLQKLPHGAFASLFVVALYRVTGQSLSVVDWTIVAAICAAATARSLVASAGPYSAMFSHTLAYMLGSAIIETLRFIRLLSPAERCALRKRIKVRFIRCF